MTKDIDAAMNSMPPEWKSRWCNSHMCACMGCANKAGGLTAKGYTYQDWRDWISRNKEDYMNGLSPIKEVKWNEATEMKQNELIDKLQNNNWKIQMKNARYPMLEVIDENTVKIEGVEYKKVEKPKPPTLLDIIRDWNDDDDDPPCEVLADMIADWFPPSKGNTEHIDYCLGWNDCLLHLKNNLK